MVQQDGVKSEIFSAFLLFCFVVFFIIKVI